MQHRALEFEVLNYLNRHGDERDERGRDLVPRNGKERPRKVMGGSGRIEVSAPRVSDKRAA